jgi:large subunit ribosomal protein L5
MTDPNLKIRLEQNIYPELSKELGIKNPMAYPRFKKVVINIGIPKTDTSKKDLDEARAELSLISGQQAKMSSAKQSIAGFKIREGDPVGVSVTLRGQRMFDFLDKLCRIVLPQVKDFRGVKRGAFDGNGNYTLGLTEQIIFPEIDYAKVNNVRGLEITIVTSTKSDEQAFALLKSIGMPFVKEEEQTHG